MVVTDKAVLDFDDVTKEMKIRSLHPGVTLEEVVDNTGFDLKIPDEIPETVAPTDYELDLIRNKIDPEGYWLKARLTGEEASLEKE